MTTHWILVLAAIGCSFGPLAAGADEVTDRLRSALKARLPNLVIETVTPASTSGLFEVVYDAGVLYVTEDGRFALSGKLIDLETREDLTEKAHSGRRLATLGSVPESQMIVFEADGEPTHTITTFTDIDCPYCRKMHAEMAAMNHRGIRVRYMLFPRAGSPSSSYEKAVSVWCATDRNSAMTQAKQGKTPPKRQCDNPVDQHMALARRLGLRGTPFTITDTGRAISGYMPTPALVDSLDADKRATTQ